MEKETSNYGDWESLLKPPNKLPGASPMLPKQASGCELGRSPCKYANMETMVWTRHIQASGPHLYFPLWSNGLVFRFVVAARKTRIEHCQKRKKELNTVSTLGKAGRYVWFLSRNLPQDS